MQNQEFKWVKHLATSFQLQNKAGVKIWLYRGPLGVWYLSLGDLPEPEKFPSTFSESLAKRMALGKVLGYLNNMVRQLERFRNDSNRTSLYLTSDDESDDN